MSKVKLRTVFYIVFFSSAVFSLLLIYVSGDYNYKYWTSLPGTSINYRYIEDTSSKEAQEAINAFVDYDAYNDLDDHLAITAKIKAHDFDFFKKITTPGGEFYLAYINSGNDSSLYIYSPDNKITKVFNAEVTHIFHNDERLFRHIDTHINNDNYIKAKPKLFSTSAINALSESLAKPDEIFVVGMPPNHKQPDWVYVTGHIIRLSPNNIELVANIPMSAIGENFPITVCYMPTKADSLDDHVFIRMTYEINIADTSDVNIQNTIYDWVEAAKVRDKLFHMNVDNKTYKISIDKLSQSVILNIINNAPIGDLR